MAPVETGSAGVTNTDRSDASPGANRSTIARMRDGAAWLATRNRTDSGSSNARTGIISSGINPPSTSTLCQPNCGIIQAERNPAQVALNETPQIMKATDSDRIRSGTYSEMSVAVIGTTAPVPRPVRNRNITR